MDRPAMAPETPPHRHSSLRGGVFVGLGANLPSAIGPPRETLEEALRRMDASGAPIVQVSSWYESAPLRRPDQPRFVNGVAEVGTALDPVAFLDMLHGIEASLGRVRRKRWEARVIDLDIVDFRGLVRSGVPPILPHIGLTERLFVLLPLRELSPQWRHPECGRTIREIIAGLPCPPGTVHRLPDPGSGA